MTLGWYNFLCLFVLVSLGVVLADDANNLTHHLHLGHGKTHNSGNRVPNYYYTQITVDQSGHGRFSTIQSAIDSIPSNNNKWVYINVKAGTYREKVVIPNDKPYIIIKGEGQKTTLVEWNDHESSAQSPTFSALADYLVVKSITFTNSYNNDKNAKNMVPALAAMISGDKLYFYDVGFFGLQDTLWDAQGRHYYRSCVIQGAMDFIYGAAQSLFEVCSISAIDGALGPGIIGFITAQGRENPNDSNGFVFKSCSITGSGLTYLGRPWRAYARVLFYNTKMQNIIQPLGWQPWNFHGQEDHITFAEYGNSGPGSDTTNRVKWLKKLDSSTINSLISTTFIDTEGWLKTLEKL